MLEILRVNRVTISARIGISIRLQLIFLPLVEGQKLIQELVKTADVVIENYKVGSLKNMGWII